MSGSGCLLANGTVQNVDNMGNHDTRESVLKKIEISALTNYNLEDFAELSENCPKLEALQMFRKLLELMGGCFEQDCSKQGVKFLKQQY